MTEKKVFTSENLSELLRLQADAFDRGEVLEFDQGRLIGWRIDELPYKMENYGWFNMITIKPKPQLRKATALEWLEWACSDDCKGWAVRSSNEKQPQPPQFMNYMECILDEFQRAKFENGKLGEFDYFWVEV